MARRYNQYNDYTVDPTLGEIGYSTPTDWSGSQYADLAAQMSQQRQARYDEASERYYNAMSELGAIQGAEADQPALVQYLADKGEAIKKNIADLYGSDYGQAKNYIMGEVAKLRPIYAQAAKIGQEEAKQKQLYEQLNAQDKLIGDMGIFQKPTFDPKTGRFASRTYDPLQRSEYDKELQGTLTAINNTAKESGLHGGSGVAGILKSITNKGMAYFNDPNNRAEYETLVNTAAEGLLKNTTWAKDKKYISNWDSEGNPINAAKNYVDKYLKSQAISDTKIDYVTDPNHAERLRAAREDRSSEQPILPSRFIKTGNAQFKLPGYEGLNISEAYDKAVKNNDSGLVQEINKIFTGFDNSTEGKIAKTLVNYYRDVIKKDLQKNLYGKNVSPKELEEQTDKALRVAFLDEDPRGMGDEMLGIAAKNSISFVRDEIHNKRKDLFSKTNKSFKKFRDEYSAPELSFDANSQEEKKKAIGFIADNANNGVFLPVDAKYATGSDQKSGWDAESLNDFNTAVAKGKVKDVRIIQATKHTKSPIARIQFSTGTTIGKEGTLLSDTKNSIDLKISKDPDIRQAAMVELSVLGQDPSVMYDDRNAYLEGLPRDEKDKDRIPLSQYGPKAFVDKYEGGGYQFVDNNGVAYWGQTPASAEEVYKRSNGLRNMTDVYLEKIHGVNMSKSDKDKYALNLLNQGK